MPTMPHMIFAQHMVQKALTLASVDCPAMRKTRTQIPAARKKRLTRMMSRSLYVLSNTTGFY
jgi:hypothetical protein